MAIIKTVEGKTPRWGKNCFIAENAVLTGDCILGDDCSIWYSAVLRSDVDAIRCGNRVNVQDCACIHQTGTMPCILEDDVSVGHGAIVHGATVRKGALIGMNATVLDKADISYKNMATIIRQSYIDRIETYLGKDGTLSFHLEYGGTYARSFNHISLSS